MKFSLLQENLNTALSSVSRFVSQKSQLPILSHILFSSDNGRLRLSATNLELGINYWIGAKIDKEGVFTIPAKEITEFVSYLPTGRLDVELNNQSLLEVSTTKAQSTFTTSAATDFPLLPQVDEKSVLEIDLKILSDAISQVAFAAATDDTRPVLTTVLCRFTPNSLGLVATDGFRLSLKDIKLVNPISLPQDKENLTLLIPARSLQEVVKFAKTSKKLKIGLSQDAHQLSFLLGSSKVIFLIIVGLFRILLLLKYL